MSWAAELLPFCEVEDIFTVNIAGQSPVNFVRIMLMLSSGPSYWSICSHVNDQIIGYTISIPRKSRRLLPL